MKTEELIRALAEDDAVVAPYIDPMYCAILWFAGSVGYFGFVLFSLGHFSGVFGKISDWQAIAGVAAPLMTSMAAAAAAFCSACPGRPNWERFAPIPFLLAWGAVFLNDAWRNMGWPQIGEIGVFKELYVLLIVLAANLAPAAGIFFAVRRGAPIAPRLTMSLAGLAVASLSAAILRLTYCGGLCPSVHFWQVTSVLTIVGLFAFFGPSRLRWKTASEFRQTLQFNGSKSPKR